MNHKYCENIRNEILTEIHSQVTITPWMRATRDVWNKVMLGITAKVDVYNQVQEQTNDG